MKAWICSTQELEGFDDFIVFAETRGQAQASGSSYFNVHFLDVKVERAKWADGLARCGNEVDCKDKEVARVLRERGWWYSEEKRCAECGLSEWEDLESSHLVNGVCGDCRRE